VAYAKRGAELPSRSLPTLAELVTTARLGKPDAAKTP